MRFFKSLPRLVQIILLIIPAINWIVEIFVRACQLIKKPNLTTVVMFIISIVAGVVLGWVDLVWLLVNNHLVCEK